MDFTFKSKLLLGGIKIQKFLILQRYKNLAAQSIADSEKESQETAISTLIPT